MIDAGQCNDCYSLIMTALKLQEVLNAPDINHVPVVYNISWYEQKAVLVLLTLLSLDVRRIHLGPTMPGFLSEVIGGLLISNFKMGTISGDVKADIEKILSDARDPISRTTIIGDLLQEYPAAGDILISSGSRCELTTDNKTEPDPTIWLCFLSFYFASFRSASS